jgi:hypothetical protein
MEADGGVNAVTIAVSNSIIHAMAVMMVLLLTSTVTAATPPFSPPSTNRPADHGRVFSNRLDKMEASVAASIATLTMIDEMGKASVATSTDKIDKLEKVEARMEAKIEVMMDTKLKFSAHLSRLVKSSFALYLAITAVAHSFMILGKTRSS